MVQLYVSAPHHLADKPKSELKAYAKTKLLKPGETETVTLTLSPKDLASFITAKSAWIAEAGPYTVSAGASSLDIRQSANFQLPKEITVEKVQHVLPEDQPFKELKP